jgi:hypothetical protein
MSLVMKKVENLVVSGFLGGVFKYGKLFCNKQTVRLLG